MQWRTYCHESWSVKTAHHKVHVGIAGPCGDSMCRHFLFVWLLALNLEIQTDMDYKATS